MHSDKYIYIIIHHTTAIHKTIKFKSFQEYLYTLWK